MTQDGEVVGGILYDITLRVSEILGLSFRFMEMPRKRLDDAMLANSINVRNYSNPAWTPSASSFRWSPPLFLAEDRILTLRNHRPIMVTEDLQGMRIGTILGYVYPVLDPLFERNLIHRDDVTFFGRNFQKLLLRRIDGMVADSILLQWISREQKDTVALQPLMLSSYSIHWAITPELDKAFPRLIPTLKTMVEDGTITTILSKYR